MDILGKIFNSDARVKLMRLFLLNSEELLGKDAIKRRSQISDDVFRREIKILEKSGFLEKKESFVLVPRKTLTKPAKKRGRGRPRKIKTEKIEVEEVKLVPQYKKKKIKGWQMSDDFPLRNQFSILLFGTDLLQHENVASRFDNAGLMKMIVLSGIFVKDEERRVDILLVGEKLSKVKLERAIFGLEADIGRELRYSVFTPSEYKYRLAMYDNLLLDIFQNSHVKVLDKLKINS